MGNIKTQAESRAKHDILNKCDEQIMITSTHSPLSQQSEGMMTVTPPLYMRSF